VKFVTYTTERVILL